jgi:glutathione synthase/RimK-type ligase-like ATP-grasp enzyme
MAERPILAVAYGPRSVPVLQLVEAAAGRCELVWMIDDRLPEMGDLARLLRRFGTVVATGGLSIDGAVDAVGPHRPDGIATYFDAGMVDIAHLAVRLELPFYAPETATAMVDKLVQRQMMATAGLDVPRFWDVPTSGDLESVLGEIDAAGGWPVVLKPRSESGSHHTFFATDAKEAKEALSGLGAARRDMVAEEYIEGDPRLASSPFADYLSVESVVSGGVVSHVALTGRFPQAEMFRETGFFIPAVLEPDLVPAVVAEAERAIASLGVEIGCLHTEVKLTPSGPRIIEVNGRPGGGVPEMASRAAGVDLFGMSIDVALGKDVRVDGPVDCQRVGYRFFLQPPPDPSTVTTIDGIDRLADHPWIDGISIHRGPGSHVDGRDGSRTFVLAVVGSAPDHASVIEVDGLLRDTINVTYSAEVH